MIITLDSLDIIQLQFVQFGVIISLIKDFLIAQIIKNLLAMQKTRVQYLGWEDLLEKGMASHSSFLAWRIPWAEEPVGLQSLGLQRVGHD